MINIVPGLLVVAVSVVIAVAGHVGPAHSASQLRQQHNDVAGFIYAVLGVSVPYDSACGYCCLGGLRLRQGTRLKGKLVSLTTSSASLIRCQTLKDASFRNSLAHAQVVVDEEWALMAQGRASHAGLGFARPDDTSL